MWTAISSGFSESDVKLLDMWEPKVTREVRAVVASWPRETKPPFAFLDVNPRGELTLGVIPHDTFFAEKGVPKRVRQIVNNARASLPATCTCVVVLHRQNMRSIALAAIGLIAASLVS
jgi:hypothetical protein